MRPATDAVETRITQNAPVWPPANYPTRAAPTEMASSCCTAPALLAAQAALLLKHPEPLMGR